jgi:hypothetical protein
MSLSQEEVYLQLGNLVAEMPDLTHCPITPEVNRWLGRACALVEQIGLEVVTLKVACQNLSGPLREMNVQTIASAVHHALAKVELIAPARVQGSFIAAGNTLDAYAAVGRVNSFDMTKRRAQSGRAPAPPGSPLSTEPS